MTHLEEMKYTLDVIKTVCADMYDCNGCPFSLCTSDMTPAQWNDNEIKNLSITPYINQNPATNEIYGGLE